MKKVTVTVTYVNIEDFFEFLTQNKCTLAFLRNLLAHRDGAKELVRLDGVFKSDPEEMIISSFVWLETPEGFDYWKSLDSKWRDLLKASDRIEVQD